MDLAEVLWALKKPFWRATEHTAEGPLSMAKALSDVLDEIARDRDGRWGGDVAFVVDTSGERNVALALNLAIAANRSKFVPGRFAIVSCALTREEWSARVGAPLGPDVYDVERAARGEGLGFATEEDGRTGGCAWAGLAEAARLNWSFTAGPPEVILLTDERPHALLIQPDPPEDDPDARGRVASWALETHAHLRVIKGRLEEDDGAVDSLKKVDTLLRFPSTTIAGLFHHARGWDGASTLKPILREVVARATSGGSRADIVLLINDTAFEPSGPWSLAVLRDDLERFAHTPGHRLALVIWHHHRSTASVVGFQQTAAIPGILAGLRPEALDAYPASLFEALATVRALPWARGASKSVVVLTPSVGGFPSHYAKVIDWVDEEHVDITIL